MHSTIVSVSCFWLMCRKNTCRRVRRRSYTHESRRSWHRHRYSPIRTCVAAFGSSRGHVTLSWPSPPRATTDSVETGRIIRLDPMLLNPLITNRNRWALAETRIAAAACAPGVARPCYRFTRPGEMCRDAPITVQTVGQTLAYRFWADFSHSIHSRVRFQQGQLRSRVPLLPSRSCRGLHTLFDLDKK